MTDHSILQCLREHGIEMQISEPVKHVAMKMEEAQVAPGQLITHYAPRCDAFLVSLLAPFEIGPTPGQGADSVHCSGAHRQHRRSRLQPHPRSLQALRSPVYDPFGFVRTCWDVHLQRKRGGGNAEHIRRVAYGGAGGRCSHDSPSRLDGCGRRVGSVGDGPDCSIDFGKNDSVAS